MGLVCMSVQIGYQTALNSNFTKYIIPKRMNELCRLVQ